MGGNLTRFTDTDLINFSLFFCFIMSVCLSVALLKATYAENVYIVLHCLNQKAFIINSLCVLMYKNLLKMEAAGVFRKRLRGGLLPETK